MRDLIVVAAIILLVVMFFVVRSKVKNDEVSIQTNSSETNQRTGELGESSQGSKDSVDVRSGTSSADSPESNKANGNGKQPGSENFPSDGGPGNSNGTPPSQTESERPSGVKILSLSPPRTHQKRSALRNRKYGMLLPWQSGSTLKTVRE